MPLLSVDGSQQPLIGRRPWWQVFERFVGSELHAELCARVQPYIQSCDYIHSGQVGSEILSNLTQQNPTLLETFPSEVIGSLFGMTLWNLIASSAVGVEWIFIKEPVEQGEIGSTEYFRRQSQNR